MDGVGSNGKVAIVGGVSVVAGEVMVDGARRGGEGNMGGEQRGRALEDGAAALWQVPTWAEAILGRGA